MFYLIRKEISGLFGSLVAFIITGLFLVTAGLFLWVFPDTSILDYGYAGLETFFNISPYLFVFLIPALTMRSIAAEKKEGTFELLSTLPLSDWQIVAGKFAGCFAVVVFTLVPTLVYYVTVYQLGVIKGNVDTGAVIGSYAGLLLLGSLFTAIGIFSSSLTSNQVIAFALAVFLCFFMFAGFDSASRLLSFQAVETRISALGIKEHYESMSRGVMDSRDLVYFISAAFLFLLFTKIFLGGRRW